MKEYMFVDKMNYFRFCKCHGHETDECIHLQDEIEYLIKKGKFGRYTKEIPK